MTSRISLFSNFLVKAVYFSIAAAFIGTALCQSAHAQISFGGATQLVDNDANQGSPTIIWYKSEPVMYYVNHSNNTIYVDFGLSGNPISTGISVYSAELTDVGAAVLGSQVLISYFEPNQSVAFALSSNGSSFGAPVTPAPSSLGLNGTPNSSFVPALLADDGSVYVATVGDTNGVYIASTVDGVNYTPIGQGSVSTCATISRPSLTIYQGVWVGYTSSCAGSRYAVVGPATSHTLGIATGAVSWGNSNRNGNYAGINLIVYNSALYVFGQDTASSQQLKYMYCSSDCATWSAASDTGNQMRWTPSLILSPSNIVYLVYQDDGNTNISYRLN